jgi:redox-sensitive bicupin YhaK (pirin superfamily)
MEIVTYVLEGALEHRDSMGNGEVLRPGEFQRMSAGTGITHSEFNPSSTEPVHLYQIWLFPEVRNVTPSYEQKRFPEEWRTNAFQLVASPDGRDGSLRIHQDAQIFLATVESGNILRKPFGEGRYGWVQVLRGVVEVNGMSLKAGDGAALSAEPELTLQTQQLAEVMVFDLP